MPYGIIRKRNLNLMREYMVKRQDQKDKNNGG